MRITSLPLFLIATLSVWQSSAAHADSGKVIEFRLKPVWEIIDDGKQPFLFGVLEDLLIDDEGNVFVLDSQMSNIKVFSPAGDYLRTLGRPGDGPGEFRAVGALNHMPDGSIGVVSKMRSKIYKIDPMTGHDRGVFVGEGLSNRTTMIRHAKFAEDLPSGTFIALVRELNRGMWNNRSYLALYKDLGNNDPIPPLDVIAEVGLTEGNDKEEEEFYWLWDPWTIDSLGRIVLAPYWGKFQLRYYSANGELELDISFPFEHRNRTPEEEKRLLHLMWGGESPSEYGVELELSNHEAVIREIFPRPNGDIWIRTNRSGENSPDGVFLTLDSISQTGQMNQVVHIIGNGNESLDRIYFSHGNRVIVIQGAEGFVRTARGMVDTSLEYDLKIVAYDLVETNRK